MNKNPYTFCLCSLLFSFLYISLSAQSPFSSDSLSLSWERMDGPPAYIAKYAQQGNILFAASEEVLFNSFDNGKNWSLNAAFGRKRIKQLYANAQVVLVIAEEPVILEPGHPFSVIELHQVYRSADGGQSWQKVLSLMMYPEVAGWNTPYEIVAKNDTVLGFNYQQYTFGLFSRNDFYYSSDLGLTWNYFTENASVLDAHNDTIVYVKQAANGSGLVVRVSGKTDFSDSKAIPLSGTPATWPNLKKVAYSNGAVFIFLSDKSLWRSHDDGQTWQWNQLVAAGDLEQVVWEDSVYYLKTNSRVYKARSSNYLALTPASPSSAKTFGALPAGFFVNDASNQTQFSNNGGLSWATRSVGLSSHVGELKRHCDGLLGQSLGKGADKGGWYFYNGSDINWVPMNPPLNCCTLGTFNGYLFQYWAPYLYRSHDCGGTWHIYAIPLTAAPNGMLAHNGKLFVYSDLDNILWYSANAGNSWDSRSLPDFGIYQMFSAGQYLVAIGQKIYRSANDGQTWEIFDKPFDANRFYHNNKNLVGTYTNEAFDGQMNIYRSPDFGANWEQTAHFVPDTCGGFWQFATAIKAVTDSLVFLHHDKALYVSGNQGLDWTRISQTPFNRRFGSNCPAYVRDTFIGQAERYFFDGGYVYASTEAHGLWRTALKPIYEYLFQGMSASPEPGLEGKLQVFPNPAKTVVTLRLPGNMSELKTADLRIYSADGKLRLVREVDVFGMGGVVEIPVGGWPAGMYLVQLKTEKQAFQRLFSKQ